MKKCFGKTIVGLAIVGAVMSSMMMSVSAESVNDFQGYDMSQEPSYRRLDVNSGITTYSSSTGVDINYVMPAAEWRKITSVVTAADIAVSKDSTTLGVDHGHAALLIDNSRTVEHYGPKGKGLPGATGYSKEYLLSDMWRHFNTVRVYRYNGIKDYQKQCITSYARNSLIGWPYNVIASRTDENEMNCATLVWKAYHEGGIDLEGYWNGFVSYTMLPSDFVEQNPNLAMKASVGWTSGEHSWK